MIALTPDHRQAGGIAVLVLVGLLGLGWVIRAAMGWHSGRALYWLNDPRPDDHDDHGDDDGGDAQ